MAKMLLWGTGALVLAVGLGLYGLSAPIRLPASAIAAESGDVENGRLVFHTGGCASCHAGGDEADASELGGGEALATAVGTFYGPNISPHPEHGIGAWSLADFANALQRGVAPDGSHYYPAFPYTSYARMSPEDVSDLYAFIATLPAVEGSAPAHEIGFPFNIRRGVGLWKRAFLSDAPVVELAADASPALLRGRYLVEGPGHCGECHTPRTFRGFGGLDHSRWLAGAPSPEGDGSIPDITPGGLDWSEEDIAYYLESGFTPDFDMVGGLMSAVVNHTAQLPPEDREAIAAYLKAVPAIE